VEYEVSKTELWGGGIPTQTAIKIAQAYPALTADFDTAALARMLQEAFVHQLTCDVATQLVHEQLAVKGITQEMISAKIDQFLEQTGNDDEKAYRLFQRWMRRMTKKKPTIAAATDPAGGR
jgi:hypothetical protein